MAIIVIREMAHYWYSSLSSSVFLRHLPPSRNVSGYLRRHFPLQMNSRYHHSLSLPFTAPILLLPLRRILHFPCCRVPQLYDVGGRGGEHEHQPVDGEPVLSPIIQTRNLLSDQELLWQDLMGIMGPQVSGRIGSNQINIT